MLWLKDRKPITFKSFLPLDFRDKPRRQDIYVVTVHPEQYITFRPLGCGEAKAIDITLAEILKVALRKETKL